MRSRRDGRHDDALAILRAGVAAADPAACVRRYLRRDAAAGLVVAGEPLRAPRRVHLLAAGKAAIGMAGAVHDVIGEITGERLVVVPVGVAVAGPGTSLGGHPIPDGRSLECARQVHAMLRAVHAEDLLIVALSGGASALLGDVAGDLDGITVEDLGETTRLLQQAGATVQEINAVRKHLGTLKGGRLAAAAHPARVVALVLSDVVGSPLDAVASGPTVADPTTFADCLEVLRARGLGARVPDAVQRRLREGEAGRVEETPKPGDPRLETARTLLVGDNRLALRAATAEAGRRGYRAHLATARLVGEAGDAGRRLAGITRRLCARRPLHRDVCLLAGGETTVNVRGGGRGGRNQEMVLAAVPTLDGLRDVCFASLGTDGVDGTSDAAGAWADGTSAARAAAAGIDPLTYLADNDSDAFFRQLGTAITTGPTGTNVMDLQVILVGAR